MKIQHYVLIFIVLLFGFLVFYRYQNQLSLAYERTNTEYAQALTAACNDAAKTIKTSNLTDSDGVWETKDDINHTLEVFYETLSRNFGFSGEMLSETMKEKTPFVILVDIDGFYISFNAVFDDFDNANIPSNFDGHNVITDINTWTEKRGSSIVRYYLNDYVQVTASNNKLYEGDRSDVFKELSSAGVLSSDLAYLNNETLFDEAKNHTIVNKLESEINYFVNTQIVNVSKYFTGYNITLSEVPGEDWSRMIKNPSVISFLQGQQQHFGGKTFNVYAFAGGELTNKTMYFIEGTLYYPYDGNVQETTTTTVINGVTVPITTYTHNGVPVTNVYTLEQCVKLGATPAY